MSRLKKKLKSIALIDDDSINNFISESLLKQMGLTDHIVKFESPFKALSYLESIDRNSGFQPDLILLDINMPIMNGWEFLEKFRNDLKSVNEISIVMLSSSLDQVDFQKAEQAPEISLYINKPLDEKGIERILTTNFSDFLL